MLSLALVIVGYLSNFAAGISNFAYNDFTDDENRQHVKREGISAEDNPNSIDILPGVYPTYSSVPRTEFSCNEKLLWHYYADPETECQAFHICESRYSKISFICPVGSIFNQKYLICDWFYNFNCDDAVSLYPLGNEFNEEELSEEVENIRDEIGFDLSPASSKGNVLPVSDARVKNVPRRDEGYNRGEQRHSKI